MKVDQELRQGLVRLEYLPTFPFSPQTVVRRAFFPLVLSFLLVICGGILFEERLAGGLDLSGFLRLFLLSVLGLCAFWLVLRVQVPVCPELAGPDREYESGCCWNCGCNSFLMSDHTCVRCGSREPVLEEAVMLNIGRLPDQWQTVIRKLHINLSVGVGMVRLMRLVIPIPVVVLLLWAQEINQSGFAWAVASAVVVWFIVVPDLCRAVEVVVRRYLGQMLRQALIAFAEWSRIAAT